MKPIFAFLCIAPLVVEMTAAAGGDCCKVDGGLTEWTQFTPCSASCGTGEKTRQRFCTAPYPQNGGKGCSGALTETVACKLADCPQDGGWSKWKPGVCSKTCGGGTRLETRTCTNPTPDKCGKDCVGPNRRTTDCNKHDCPKWVWRCDEECKAHSNGACSRRCKQRCSYLEQIVDDSLCTGNPKEKYEICLPTECPYGWRYDCVNETDEKCFFYPPNSGVCLQNCTQKCVNVETGEEVEDDNKCPGDAKTKKITCQKKNIKDDCPDHQETACADCKWPKQCPDSEVNADLHAFCTDQNIEKSKTNNIPAGQGYYIQCAARNWCRPCATSWGRLNVKKDWCE